jgi:hypothetical protein
MREVATPHGHGNPITRFDGVADSLFTHFVSDRALNIRDLRGCNLLPDPAPAWKPEVEMRDQRLQRPRRQHVLKSDSPMRFCLHRCSFMFQRF